MTAQIIAFKITDYIYVFIFAGFLIHFVCKSERIKNIGQTIFAFGLLFLGIETMGSVMKPLASSTFFTNLIGQVAEIPVLGVLVGTLMTLVVQSSSATIAVLQNFAAQAGPDGVTSIIGLTGAIPILLGDNIGTTITALLASVGQSRDAKRTAAAHCMFNLSGAFLFIWFVGPYAKLIQYISPKGNEVDVISRQIANAHTGFNLIMTLIWIPLIPLMVKIVMKIVPERTAKTAALSAAPMYLDNKLIGQPAAALKLVEKEVIRCSRLVGDMLEEMKGISRKEGKAAAERIGEKAGVVEALNGRINEYLTAVFAEGVLTEEQAEESTGLMYVLCDVERIGNLCRKVSENISMQNPENGRYSKEALKHIRQSMGTILDMYSESIRAVISGERVEYSELQKWKDKIVQLDDDMRRAHLERVRKKKCNATMTAAFTSLLHDISRMGNSCVNLVEMAVNEASEYKGQMIQVNEI